MVQFNPFSDLPEEALSAALRRSVDVLSRRAIYLLGSHARDLLGGLPAEVRP